MAQLNVPDSPTVKTTHYKQLLGVDYSDDQTAISRYHSPNMVNMISDKGGNPIKRYGIRSIGDAPDKMVYKNGKYYTMSRDVYCYLKEIEWLNYSFSDVSSHEILKVSEKFNAMFHVSGNIYAKSPTLFVNYDIEEDTLKTIDINETVGIIDSDIVPTVSISLKPDGTDGAVLDDVNVFTPYQANTFIGDATSRAYTVTSDKIGRTIKAEVLQSDGTWLTKPATLGTGTTVSAKNRNGDTYTETIYDGVVTFATAPPAPDVTGADNVRITFSSFNNIDEDDGVKDGFYSDVLVDILESEVSTVYNSRWFVSVGERVYYSNLNDPNIISDLNWFDLDDTVIGFSPFGNYLAIVCMENGNNTVFLASVATADEVTSYSIEPTSSGVGAVAVKSFDTLNDEPMFLANTGLYTLLTNWYSKNFTYNRSNHINRKLTEEANLENAVGATCDNYYYLAINSRMYVLDGRKKTKDEKSNTSYEAYYFDNLPTIKDIFVFENRMYMTDDTSMYVWNEDIASVTAYADYGTVVDDKIDGGEAVKAKWCSMFDGDSQPQILKTLNKKGTMFSLAPYSQSGATLTLIKDVSETYEIGTIISNTFSWENLSFLNFTFDTNIMVKDTFVKKKIKKYKRLQICLENNSIEPFGIIEAIKSYSYGNYAKR